MYAPQLSNCFKGSQRLPSREAALRCRTTSQSHLASYHRPSSVSRRKHPRHVLTRSQLSRLNGCLTFAGLGLRVHGRLLEDHVKRLYRLASTLSTPEKYLVAIGGSPGSGKTSAADLACKLLNKMGKGQGSIPLAVAVSMDGFHYYRRQLDEMENPEEAHARRGAHWTFNATAFVQAIRILKETGQAKMPSFDHAVGDPVEEDVNILQEHKIVFIEGNYVLLDIEPWSSLASIFDESWYIACNIDTAMDRVIARQVRNGSNRKTAKWRVNNNDRPNAMLIQPSVERATYVVPSLPYKQSGKLPNKVVIPEE